MKEHIIYDNFDIYSDGNRQEAARSLLEAAERSGGFVRATDNFGRKVLLTEREYIDYLSVSGMVDRECESMDTGWFSAELENLSCIGGGDIVAIADIRKWNGRFTGYKEIGSLPDVLYSSADYEKVYVDSNGDLRKRESRHDGSNNILYRRWKSSATERQKARFLGKCLDGSLRPSDITRLTCRAGCGIADYYGWKVRGSAKSGR